MKNKILRPLLKYPGGKSSELNIIIKNMPKVFDSYIEPFVGGGAVYFYLNNKENYINDKSQELMLLYNYVKRDNKTFYNELNIIVSNWNKLGELSRDSRIMDLYIHFRNNETFDMVSKLSEIINGGLDKVPMFTLRKSVKFEEFLVKCLYSKFMLLKKMK